MNIRKGFFMKILFILIGFLSLILGVIGIFLPVLPTVPFLLLASWCFAKGSKKFHLWFKSTSIYRNHLESFEKEKSMTMSSKIKILFITTAMLLFVILKYDILPMRITIIVLLIVKYYYFLRVVKTKESLKEKKKENVY